MPYPTDPPTNKHDFLVPRADDVGFDSTSRLFTALAEPLLGDVHLLAAVYSYADAPKPPLSRQLVVIGTAHQSLSVVRKLVNDDDLPDCLHRCRLGVKRADGAHRSALAGKDVDNSSAFGDWMRQLAAKESVAILSQDKYQRFMIVQPNHSAGPDDEDDYYAVAYVGDVEKVKEYLTSGIAVEAAPVPAPEPAPGLWQPPGASEPSADDGVGLWQPPGTSSEGLWQPPSSTAEESFDFTTQKNDWQVADSGALKRQRDGVDEEFHADSTAAAADAFYSGLTRTLDTRADSRIYHMRAFNGWVKATQVQELAPKTSKSNPNAPMRVLDLACGKGGDLGKWVIHPRGIGNYVGIDVARGSLKDAAERVRKMRQKLKRCTFTCADLGADVPGRLKAGHKHMQKLLTWSLQNESPHTSSPPEFKWVRGGGISEQDRFDVVSIQFAIHYMMSTRTRARRFFNTVSQLLEVGGNLIATTIDARVVIGHMMNLGLDLHFDDGHDSGEALVQTGNGACRIRFQPEIVKRIFHPEDGDDLFGLEYTFTLVEGSDHDSGVGDAVNLPEWLTPIPVLESLAEEAGLVLEYAHNFHEFYEIRKDPSMHAAAHMALYNMKVLNRNGSIAPDEWEISRLYMAVKFRKVRESTMTDMDDDSEEEQEEDLPEVDPALKTKLLPMAMMKAKKAVGNDEWNELSSEEKTRLTDIELRKMAAAKS